MTPLPLLMLAASELPDPGKPSTVSFAATAGGIVGGLIARLRELPDDRLARLTADGFFLGGAGGLVCRSVIFAIDRL
jgi:hypothetical protein